MNETKSQLIPSIHWSPEFILASGTLLLCLFLIFTYFFLKAKMANKQTLQDLGWSCFQAIDFQRRKI